MKRRHIRDERATREVLGLIGDDRQLSTDCGVAWCSERFHNEWCFLDASHALLSLRYQGDIAPCLACLRALRLVIDREFGDKPHPELLK